MASCYWTFFFDGDPSINPRPDEKLLYEFLYKRHRYYSECKKVLPRLVRHLDRRLDQFELDDRSSRKAALLLSRDALILLEDSLLLLSENRIALASIAFRPIHESLAKAELFASDWKHAQKWATRWFQEDKVSLGIVGNFLNEVYGSGADRSSKSLSTRFAKDAHRSIEHVRKSHATRFFYSKQDRKSRNIIFEETELHTVSSATHVAIVIRLLRFFQAADIISPIEILSSLNAGVGTRMGKKLRRGYSLLLELDKRFHFPAVDFFISSILASRKDFETVEVSRSRYLIELERALIELTKKKVLLA